MEFDFDFPFEPCEADVAKLENDLKIARHEATALLYQRNWKEKRRELQLQTRCLSAMLERGFPKSKFSFWKIQVEFVKKRKYASFRDLLGVLVVEQEVDLAWFELQSQSEKMHFLLRRMENAVQIIGEAYPAICAPFSEAANFVKCNNFRNIWNWRSDIHNFSKSMKADAVIEHTPDAVVCSLIIKDRHEQQIYSEQLFTTVPDEWAYDSLLGKLKWKNDITIVLSDRNGELVKEIRLRKPL